MMNVFSVKFIVLLCFLANTTVLAQKLPIHFEKQNITFTGGRGELDKPGFSGGTGEILDNPDPSGINTSKKVGKIIRDGGEVWAGSRIPVSQPFDFRTDNIITFKVYTSAPAGTKVQLKLEDREYTSAIESYTYTTTSNEWETIEISYAPSATAYNYLTFMFDIGRIGKGEERDVFYFDNITQTSPEVLNNPSEPEIVYSEDHKTNDEPQEPGNNLSVEDEDNSTLKVYPNPSSSAWKLESETLITQVEIIDLQGKKVMSLSPNQNSARISTDFLANGLYLSEITTHSGVKRVKLIKH